MEFRSVYRTSDQREQILGTVVVLHSPQVCKSFVSTIVIKISGIGTCKVHDIVAHLYHDIVVLLRIGLASVIVRCGIEGGPCRKSPCGSLVRETGPVCRQFGKPVLVMEPIKGGSLVNLPEDALEVFKNLNGGSPASYALRFAAGSEGIGSP